MRTNPAIENPRGIRLAVIMLVLLPLLSTACSSTDSQYERATGPVITSQVAAGDLTGIEVDVHQAVG